MANTQRSKLLRQVPVHGVGLVNDLGQRPQHRRGDGRLWARARGSHGRQRGALAGARRRRSGVVTAEGLESYLRSRRREIEAELGRPLGHALHRVGRSARVARSTRSTRSTRFAGGGRRARGSARRVVERRRMRRPLGLGIVRPSIRIKVF